MTTSYVTESDVEAAALEWLQGLGYDVRHGPAIAPETAGAEREDFSQVVLPGRLQAAIARLNPHLPADALEDAYRKVTRIAAPSLVARNRAFHGLLVDGVRVEYRNAAGQIAGDFVRLVDFERPEANDWLAVNQFKVVQGKHKRIPDVVVFVNGLPLGVIELKDAENEQATIWTAFDQFKTYKHELEDLFTCNEALVVADGVDARIGSLTADKERFMPWRTIEGEALAPKGLPKLQVLLQGVFEPRRFLSYLRSFIVFEDDGAQVEKKLAGYHQFHAVNTAVAETVRAAHGDRRIGVVWHTQGSGKSLTMVFYAGRIVQEPAMANPTVVVLTDRNDLDDQLFGTFARCAELLRQVPEQAASRDDLQELLRRRASGGLIFTTIQKFLPEKGQTRYPQLSDRRNIVVIADEAHRSQYDFDDGFAAHLRDALPNASFIGFTGTPIELEDRSTRNVFGDYISIYDVERAQEDGAIVPIYYESRLAKLELDAREKPKVDPNFEEVTEGEEERRREQLKTKWAALEAFVGSEKRLRLIARDLVDHFETRLDALDGKAMVVCMSRRICVELYREIALLRPEWDSDEDDAGVMKIVMTGSASDAVDWQRHIRTKPGRDALARRFKDPQDPFKLVIVRDMWLTGFDVPPLHTIYVDKPMRGHGLMQAIARVNRVFKNKPGGLVVDYLGIANELREAVQTYTASGGKGRATVDQHEAVAVLQEKIEIVQAMYYGFDYSRFRTLGPADRLALLTAAQEHLLELEDGRTRYLKAVSEVSKAFALAVPHEAALALREEVAFFQAVRACLVKYGTTRERAPEELDQAIRQIISRAVASDQVVDVFAAAGLQKPDISILSDEFLAEVRDLPHKNLAVELLQKLLNDEITQRQRRNVVTSRSFLALLEQSLARYNNRAVEAAQVIEELIRLAKDLRAAQHRGEALGLNDDEIAFYDSLAENQSAVEVLGNDTLRDLAKEIADSIRKSVTVDWAIKESARARLRNIVRRLLRRYGYPPDKQEAVVQLVIEQAEELSEEWVA